MKERPILFSAPMVLAILDGTKTQTRRRVKDVSADCELLIDAGDGFWQQCYRDDAGAIHSKSWLTKCPYGMQGDRLWVRETFAIATGPTDGSPLAADNTAVIYRASWDVEVPDTPLDGAWQPSIHMPRWASRITLEITGVRAERLNSISEEDAEAEGIERVGGTFSCSPWRNYRKGEPGEMDLHCSARSRSYMALWESINGPGSWEVNPWVWVISFKRTKP